MENLGIIQYDDYLLLANKRLDSIDTNAYHSIVTSIRNRISPRQHDLLRARINNGLTVKDGIAMQSILIGIEKLGPYTEETYFIKNDCINMNSMDLNKYSNYVSELAERKGNKDKSLLKM